MKKFVCTVCGYIHVGDNPPEICPLCNVGPEYFKEVEEDNNEEVSNNILDKVEYKRFIVDNKKKENDVVTSFYLKPVTKEKLVSHKPGQFISIKPIKEGEKSEEVRQYSLSMKPGEDFYRISVKKEDKGLISSYLHDKVNVGEEVYITDPLGTFVLKDSNKPLVLISAGIGITPVMSMLYEALDKNRKVIFVQVVQNSKLQTFKKEIKSLSNENNNLKTVIFYGDPLESDKLGVDYDISGRITQEWIKDNLPENGDFYFCGPVGFMKLIYNSLKSMDIEEESINYEMFGPSANLANI